MKRSIICTIFAVVLLIIGLPLRASSTCSNPNSILNATYGWLAEGMLAAGNFKAPKIGDFIPIGSRSEEGREDFRRYWESSVDVPGPAVDALSRTARSHNVYLVVGVVERDRGTLYCSVLFFAPDGLYLGKHRKVMPTASERLVWGF